MFWTVKAPFWYALVAPRPMEEPALFAPGSHPAGVPGRLGGTPPLETSAARTRNARDQRCALASPLPPPPFARAQCFLGRTLSSALLPPLHFFFCGGRGEPTRGIDSPRSCLKKASPLFAACASSFWVVFMSAQFAGVCHGMGVFMRFVTGWLSPLVSGFGFRVSGYHFLTWR